MELERFRTAKMILDVMDELIRHRDELIAKGFLEKDHKLVFVGTRIDEKLLPADFREQYIQNIENKLKELTEQFNKL